MTGWGQCASSSTCVSCAWRPNKQGQAGGVAKQGPRMRPAHRRMGASATLRLLRDKRGEQLWPHNADKTAPHNMQRIWDRVRQMRAHQQNLCSNTTSVQKRSSGTSKQLLYFVQCLCAHHNDTHCTPPKRACGLNTPAADKRPSTHLYTTKGKTDYNAMHRACLTSILSTAV